jgi:small nuclear ribonucleoprotein (snRNP)-like protein
MILLGKLFSYDKINNVFIKTSFNMWEKVSDIYGNVYDKEIFPGLIFFEEK